MQPRVQGLVRIKQNGQRRQIEVLCEEKRTDVWVRSVIWRDVILCSDHKIVQIIIIYHAIAKIVLILYVFLMLISYVNIHPHLR